MNVQECYIFVGVDTRDLSHKTEQFATVRLIGVQRTFWDCGVIKVVVCL